MTQLQINPKDYGLEENKAKQISDMFKPMLDKMTELEVQYNEVINRPIEPETIQMAYDLRLAYVKVRTGTAAIHKDLKAFYLQGGRFVDGWKNAQLMASQGIEEKLKSIENYYVNIEKERIAKLQEKREAELRKYEVEFFPNQLGEMDDPVWDNYISGVRLNYEATKEAERKAEEERIAKEKAEAEEQERIRQENIKLKKEAEERDRLAKIEEEKRVKAEKERIAKEQAEQKEREERERKEREAYEAKLKAQREERERFEEQEKAKRKKIEDELKAKQDAERKAKEDEEARIQAELSKGDSDKVSDLISDLQALKTKYQFKSKINKDMYVSVGVLIEKVVTYINEKS